MSGVDRMDLLERCRTEIVGTLSLYYFPDGDPEGRYDEQFRQIAEKVLDGPAHQQLRGAVERAESAEARLRAVDEASVCWGPDDYRGGYYGPPTGGQ